MITIISGTNRPDSNTLKVANTYSRILADKGISSNLLDLTAITGVSRNSDFEAIEANFLIPTEKYLIVTPEYNGSVPGIFKLLIDQSRPNLAWHNKKAALVGLATGRAGNLRGMDHATGMLNHLKVTVLPNKLPLSTVDKLIGPSGLIEDEGTLKVINLQIEEFIKF